MKAFVWKRLEGLTEYYHSEGGLLLIAEDLAKAREFYLNEGGRLNLQEPDFVFEAPEHTQETVVVFPDAGCC